MSNTIMIAPDEDLLLSGTVYYLEWNYINYPHAVIFGSTGSGKSYSLKIILARIGLYIPDATIIICDFKSDDDFTFLSGADNLFRFNDCLNGLEKICTILSDRQKGLTIDRHPVFFIFDEWASFLTSLEKKQADHAKQSLSMLLMLGRSFNIHVIVSQQRLDAAYFNSARDNFSLVLAMGKLSREAAQMMFSEFKDDLDRNKEQGHGTLLLGSTLHNVVIPRVRDSNKLHRCILSAVRRTTAGG